MHELYQKIVNVFPVIVIYGAYTRKGDHCLLSPGAVDGNDCYLFYFHVFGVLSQIGGKYFEIITKSSV